MSGCCQYWTYDILKKQVIDAADMIPCDVDGAFRGLGGPPDAPIRFLKLQVKMLRQRLSGNRVIASPTERSRLLRLGAELNHQVDDLMGIVSVKTYKR